MVTRAPTSEVPPRAASPGSGDRTGLRRPTVLRGLKTAWKSLEASLPGLEQDLKCYAMAQADRARIAVRDKAGSIARAAVLAVVALVVVISAIVLAIDGIAGGLTVALDGRAWLANLITGTGLVLLLAAAAGIRARAQRKQRLRRLAKRYARHDARQRAMDLRAAGATGP